MSTVEPTDKLLIQRGDTLYSSPVDMSTTQDTDLIIVNRAGVDYKCTIADLKAAIGSGGGGGGGGGALPAGAFSWDPNKGTYNRQLFQDRDIDVQSRMRRCVMNASGQVQYYLDADNSTRRATDWLRIIETTQINIPYEGTHGDETNNNLLRAGLPTWQSGTYNKGQRVFFGGLAWEALTTTDTGPSNGATAANLTGPDQVMVEIPRFSVWHETVPSGPFLEHKVAIKLGTKTDGGYQVHPAFIKVDGTYRDYIYVGAYTIGGAGANQSISGVTTGPNVTRYQLLVNCTGRGAGWRSLGFWDYNALQWLYLTEYQDLDSQKVLGNGATGSTGYQATTGLSNARGNRSGNSTSSGSTNDYVSYRGIENIFGRNWQFVDGINVQGSSVYLCNDPAKWAPDTQANYNLVGHMATTNVSNDPIIDFGSGLMLLPSVVNTTAASMVKDGSLTESGWGAVAMGGSGFGGTMAGIFQRTSLSSAYSNLAYSGRLCYAP